jgi:hypothetical protein
LKNSKFIFIKKIVRKFLVWEACCQKEKYFIRACNDHIQVRLLIITYMRKDDNLFMVDIDRIGQGCVAPSEQVVNNVVTTLLQLNNAVVTTVLSQMKYIPDV